MSKKHIIALFFSFVYLAVVGFTDISINPVTSLTQPLVLNTDTTDDFLIKPVEFNLNHFLEQEKVITAITRKYKRVDYETAVKIVHTVYEESRKQHVDPKLILAMIATESSFNPKAISSEGAKGYMQVIPKWHKEKILGRNIYDMKVNIEVGIKIYKECGERNKTHHSVLACYNGATTYERAIVFKQAVERHRQYFLSSILYTRFG